MLDAILFGYCIYEIRRSHQHCGVDPILRISRHQLHFIKTTFLFIGWLDCTSIVLYTLCYDDEMLFYISNSRTNSRTTKSQTYIFMNARKKRIRKMWVTRETKQKRRKTRNNSPYHKYKSMLELIFLPYYV